MNREIVEFVHRLRGYVNELKGIIKERFPEAEFDRIYRWIDPDDGYDYKENGFWMLHVYTNNGNAWPVYDLISNRRDEIHYDDGIPILVMIDPLSAKTKIDVYPTF